MLFMWRKRPAKLGVVLLLTVVLAVSASAALAADRVALVVGNSSYAHIGRLPNPPNDAADMTAALRRLGFEVTTELDTGLTELNQVLRAFTRRSAGADVSLVFYAGHGLEMNGVNYLVPVDARLERDTDVRFETVTLDDVLAVTSGAALRVVILDACRNNPLARSMQRTGASRSVSRGSFGNLDESLLGDETLVAYAAAAGTTAADGRGRNSPYTAALLAHLDEPLEILTLFRRVRARVLASTNGEQRPHEYQSLLGEHYLLGAPARRDPRLVEAALGLDRAARRRIQQRLAAAGFSPGPADGVFGPATRAAIRGWQAVLGTVVTGYLGRGREQKRWHRRPRRGTSVTVEASGAGAGGRRRRGCGSCGPRSLAQLRRIAEQGTRCSANRAWRSVRNRPRRRDAGTTRGSRSLVSTSGPSRDTLGPGKPVLARRTTTGWASLRTSRVALPWFPPRG